MAYQRKTTNDQNRKERVLAVLNDFVCSTCGETHAGLATDWSYKLPDEVWSLTDDEKAVRAKFDTDLCSLDDRYFIRCLLKIPFTEMSGYYGWGLWAEVEKAVFRRYLEMYTSDGTGEARHDGKIANALPAYPTTLGVLVHIQFEDGKTRPSIHLPPEDTSALAVEQRRGMTAKRYHDVLEANSAHEKR